MHLTFACTLLCCAIQCVSATDKSIAHINEIADGIYVRPGHHGVGFVEHDIANIGFIVGDRCVAVIDTGGSLDEGYALKKAIQKITQTPICYVINTHVHPDHILGNLAFKSDPVKFIGHHQLAKAMALVGDTYIRRAAEYDSNVTDKIIVPPDITVMDTLSLDLGNRPIVITAHPVAHTDSDLSIYDEKSSILWLSDLLFIEHIPVLDGSLAGWIEQLEKLKTVPAKYVIAGHGPDHSHWPQDADDILRYLKVIQSETREWIANDGDLVDAPDNIGLGERTLWQLFDHYHKRNVITAYTQIEWE